MLSRKMADKHAEANAAAATLILQDRAAQPPVMILWAEAFEKRQRAERAEQIATAATTATAPPQRHQCDQRAMRQRQLPLPLEGVSHAAA